MKVKTLATFEAIGAFLLGLLQLPFYFIYLLARWIADSINSIERRFGHWLLKRSSEYKAGALEKNGLQDTGYLTAKGMKSAIDNGLIRE